jgi:iron complex outermembrane receptor protein
MKILGFGILLLFPIMAFSQFKITGNVGTLDEENRSIENVLVQEVDRPSNAVKTNENGYFQIYVASFPTKLKFSRIGFQSSTIEIKEGGNMSVGLAYQPLETEEVLITAGTNVRKNTPVAVTNLNSKDLQPLNLGQDIPFLLRFTPSVVVTSDNGTGIGYTGMRIRGSDATRVNVSINGVPLNDPESQGVFWVNMPDFASSLSNVQIQRGVGSSVNGAGAFGGAVNLRTDQPIHRNYAEYSISGGSFGTLKNTLKFNVKTNSFRWNLEGRVSDIRSDGYIDRASSRLQSYYLAATRSGSKSVLKIMQFSGKERTYQSWYGTPESRVKNDSLGMIAYADRNYLSDKDRANLLNSGRTYNFYTYQNEVDQYQQDHAQMHYGYRINSKLNFQSALHFTHGAGFFEQFRVNDKFSNYQLPVLVVGSDSITSGDFIRRRYLNNYFGGLTFSLDKTSTLLGKKYHGILGGALNSYTGNHFGEIIWAQWASVAPLGKEYYRSRARKVDANLYYKAEHQVSEKLNTWLDVQVRRVLYTGTGIDNSLFPAIFNSDYLFVNPKAGLNYQFSVFERIYASASVGQKEPIRSDFVDNALGTIPNPEKMLDLEMGYSKKEQKWMVEANLFWMIYRDQLVLTGALNDVGAPLRINVPESFRRGLEIQAAWSISPNKLEIMGNLTLSQNKIPHFTELIFNYDRMAYDSIEHHSTDIAFSPSMLGSAQLAWSPIKNMKAVWMSQRVGKQYLDNTSNESRKIDAYWVNDLRFECNFRKAGDVQIRMNAIVNNVLNTRYSSNGYTFSYVSGNRVAENFFYPQAGRNFLIGCTIGF